MENIYFPTYWNETIGREGALVLLLGAFSLPKWTARGKRHESIKHFDTTKSGGDIFFFVFHHSIKNIRWKISLSSVLALQLSSICWDLYLKRYPPCLPMLRARVLLSLASPCLLPMKTRFADGRPHVASCPPARVQAHGSWVVSPGWDREFPVLASAPKATALWAVWTQAQLRDITGNSSLQCTNFIFFPKICKIHQGWG